MDQGLIIFIVSIVVLVLVIVIFQLISKGILQSWFGNLKKGKSKGKKSKKSKSNKKESKNVVSKNVKSSSHLSYWKFILSIAGAIVLSVVIMYLIIWAVKVSFDFNLITYILT
tara:strand:- start:931 stop:1269 length:339 start_codon:yes stop_codon:yes gene_type:complete